MEYLTEKKIKIMEALLEKKNCLGFLLSSIPI